MAISFDRIKNAGIAAVIAVIASVVICAAAWLTHVFTCLANGEWGFLIAGALAFPIAIVHGIGLWFGFWS
jgi:hypothetical protein